MRSFATDRWLAPCAEFPNDNPALHHGAIWRCDALRGDVAPEAALAPEPEPEPAPAPALAPAPPVAFHDQLEPPAPLALEALAPSPTEGLEPPREDAGDLDEEADDRRFDESVGDVLDEGSADAKIEIVDELRFDAIDESDSPAEAAGCPAADPFATLVQALEDAVVAHGAGDEGLAALRALFGVTRSDGLAPGEAAIDALLAAGIVTRTGRGLARTGEFTGQVVAWQGILRGESEDFAACGGAALDEWAANVVARLLGSPSRAEGIRRDLRSRGIAAFGLVEAAA